MKKIFLTLSIFLFTFLFACSKQSSLSNHPDELNIEKYGKYNVTVFRCDNLYYVCYDGEYSWIKAYSYPSDEFPIDDGDFVYIEADIDKAYGGIAGYMGNPGIKKIHDIQFLMLDEVIDAGILSSYESSKGDFDGLRLVSTGDDNYVMARDGLRKFRVYNKDGDCLGTYDTSMEAENSLGLGEDPTVQIGPHGNVPFYFFRAGDVYLAYSRYDNFNSWTPILNMDFENEPVGFTLEDGETIECQSTGVYRINGGEKGYVNTPMFDKQEHLLEITYDTLEADASAGRWEDSNNEKDGELFVYSTGKEKYLIFIIDQKYNVYCETFDGTADVHDFIGIFENKEEVDSAIGL